MNFLFYILYLFRSDTSLTRSHLDAVMSPTTSIYKIYYSYLYPCGSETFTSISRRHTTEGKAPDSEAKAHARHRPQPSRCQNPNRSVGRRRDTFNRMAACPTCDSKRCEQKGKGHGSCNGTVWKCNGSIKHVFCPTCRATGIKIGDIRDKR